jgi:hypothetical protein
MGCGVVLGGAGTPSEPSSCPYPSPGDLDLPACDAVHHPAVGCTLAHDLVALASSGVSYLV